MASLSLIIPAYNEEKRLPNSLKIIREYLENRISDYEVLIIDDGSTDNTASVSEPGLNMRVVKNIKNMGKGYSINNGVKEASKDIILFSDADLSTPIEFIEPFMKAHEQGFDIISASRAVKGSVKNKKQPFYRDLMGKIFNLFVRIVTGLPIKDTQCGFKSFTNKCAKDVYSKQTVFDFGFDVEILFIAKHRGYKILEHPVNWHDVEGSKVNAIRDSVKMFAELFTVRSNAKKGLYD